MKSVYVLCVQGIKEKGPSTEYLKLLQDTFKKLYAGPADEVYLVDWPSAFGPYMKSAFLDSSVNEFIVAPVNLAELDAISKMREQSRTHSHALVADIIPPVDSNTYYKINSDLFYVNFDLIDRSEPIDWGTYYKINTNMALHLNYPVLKDSSYTFLKNQQVGDMIVDDGWILLSRLLGLQLSIGQRNPSITVTTVDFYPELETHITEIESADVNACLNDVQRRYFRVTREILLQQWENETLADYCVTKFNQPGITVENCYMVSDLKFSGLRQLYKLNRDQNTRLVFVHKSVTDKSLIESVLAQWDGTNTASITVNAKEQSDLDQFYQSFAVGEFLEFWNYCKSIYHAHYVWNTPDFIADLESQCHVNNMFWIGEYRTYPMLLKATKVKLEASEFWYRLLDGSVAIMKVGPRYYTKNLYKKFKMTFRNTQSGQMQSISWNLKDNFLAQKWARCNQFDYLEEECIAEKNYMLQQWEYDDDNPNARNIPALCAELNRYVSIINNYFDGSSDRRVHYHITQFFDPATLDQKILNEIHHHFEILIGQVWNVSDYFKKADMPTSFAIRQLNNLCHEMESLRKLGVRDNPKYWNSYIYFPFIPGKRHKFVESDYDHFQRTREFGDLQLHYAQLGKTPLEAWAGKDEIIFDENITGLRYLSGEFIVVFGADMPLNEQLARFMHDDDKLFKWLRSRGQDPESKFTGVGTITIGEFDRTEFPGMTANEIMLELFKYDDIYKLELLGHDGAVISTKTLDYDWKYVMSQSDPTRANE